MYKVEPKLYTVIFGESILNDAIAIVLFETAQMYKPGSASGPLTALSIFEAIGIFLLVFFGSLVIGVAVGIGTALALKYTHVRRQPKIESCLIILIAYSSYFFANGVYMSGKCAAATFHSKPLSTDKLPSRYRVAFVLWNYPQTLRLLQHVKEDATYHEISVSSPCSAL